MLLGRIENSFESVVIIEGEQSGHYLLVALTIHPLVVRVDNMDIFSSFLLPLLFDISDLFNNLNHLLEITL